MTDTQRTVEQYADEILGLISDDFDAFPRLRNARSFADLHDHVDANEYMISADVPFETGDAEIMTFYVAVQDEVTRRLQAAKPIRAVTLVATLDIGDDDARASFESAFRNLVFEHGLTLLPCGWAPDAESILDVTPGVDDVDVLDMNPGWVQ